MKNNNKHFNFSLNKALLIIAFLMSVCHSSFSQILVNGIYYKQYADGTLYVTSTDNFKYKGKVVIPSSITYKGKQYKVTGVNDFVNCTELTEVHIPQTVKSFPFFPGCTNLRIIKVDNNNPYYDSRNNCNAIIRKSDNTLVAGCKYTVIPSSITQIGRYAFKNCPIHRITIPGNVKTIADGAFYNCPLLVSVTMSEGLKKIEKNAFSGCKSLRVVVLPPYLDEIGSYAFSETSLTSIIIPEGVRVLREVFVFCESLKEVVLPKSLGSLFGTFSHCSSLKTIELPDNVILLRSGVFSHCTSLENIKIPAGVERIEPNTFGHCKSLKNVYVNSNTEIYKDAFRYCPNVKIIRYNSSKEKNSKSDNKNSYSIKKSEKGGSKVLDKPKSNRQEENVSFNESSGKDYDIVDLIEYPLNLRNLNNMLLKKDFFSEMERVYPSLKEWKSIGYYSYGVKSPIDISCLGKKIKLIGVKFNNLNTKKKDSLSSIWYMFEFDNNKYSQEDYLKFVSSVLNKLEKANIMSTEKTKKTSNSGEVRYECDYKDRTIYVSIEKSKQIITFDVIYDTHRF